MMRIVSLGAGVQSTTMVLMAARGDLSPMPDAAIFADVGDEPQAVYDHLAWLRSGVLPFPIYTVNERGRLSEAVLAGDKSARPPLFVRTKTGVGMLNRQCTRNFKLRPIRQETRRLLGVGPRAYVCPGAVESWVGISTDEIVRVRNSGLAYIVNRHPLIEKRMSREDCKTWLTRHGYVIPPKSACWHCPFQSDAQWIERRDHSPAEFAQAVAFDTALRAPAMVELYGEPAYLHRSGQPLSEVELDANDDQLNLFGNDCEGMCGV